MLILVDTPHPAFLGSNTGDGLGDDLGLCESGYRDLFSHVPNTTQSVTLPALALLPVSVSAIPQTVSPFWPVSPVAQSSDMRVRTTAPVTTLRGRGARSVAKSPYSRANTTKKFDPVTDNIIKNCPAVDVLLGGYATPRSSTHSRGRDQEHISRPPNAFMVYRSYIWFTKQLENSGEKNLSCVSKLAADSWKDISEDARKPFIDVAEDAKRKHAELHPNYKYAPTSRSAKPKNPPATPKARKKAKAPATSTHEGPVAIASPLPRRATQTRKRSPDAFASAVPASPVPSSSTSAASSSSASLPTTPDLEYPYPMIRSPELGYPWDHDLPGFPQRPRLRAVTSDCLPDCIPSPAISVLELNVHESVLDTLPDVSLVSICLIPDSALIVSFVSRNTKRPRLTTIYNLTPSSSRKARLSMTSIPTHRSSNLPRIRASTTPVSFPAIPMLNSCRQHRPLIAQTPRL